MRGTIKAGELHGILDTQRNGIREAGAGDVVALDVRPNAAFHGWRLRDEARGGHVPGAVLFPLNWFTSRMELQARSELQARGVTPERSLVLIGYDAAPPGSAGPATPDSGGDVHTAAARLEELGYRDVRILAGGAQAWAAALDLPLERLPRYRQLIHPDWLSRLLRTGEAREFDGGPWTLLHVSFDNRPDYDHGHIPGAIHLDTIAVEEPEHWNRREPDGLREALLTRGITSDTTAVLYGRCGHPDMHQAQPGREAGQIAAMRAAVLLMYAGVRDVRVLDGGLGAWLAAGGPVDTTEAVPVPAKSFGAKIPARPDYVIDLEEVRGYLDDPESVVVSMRSWAEFIGEVSGYHYIGPRGRIPGSVFGNCGSDAYHMETYRNHDNTMRDPREIEALWRAAGITPDKRVAFYCGTGWRASEAFFYAHLLGWDRIAVYDGGWYEWSIDAGNPVETGIPEGWNGRTGEVPGKP
jgi:3-mercaptopyruvate sulfurtransferase SseA